MNGAGSRWSTALSHMRAIAVVVAIVATSAIGLHDWADSAATHEVAVHGGTSQDVAGT